MKKAQAAKLDRRDFFKSIVRTAIITASATTAGFLAVKRSLALGNQTCINDSACGKCPVVDTGCGLPQAMSYRQVRKQGFNEQQKG